MKASIYKILIIMGMLIGFNNIGNAYITVASSSYQLEVDEEKFLPSPQAYYGYIDHATWACASPYITFVNQASSGATIKVNKSFSGTAVVEVMAVEKYSDNSGKTRSNTYYKQYNISCKGNGSSGNNSEIIMPESIVLNIGETKYFNVVSGNYYRGAYDVTWEERNPVNFAYYNRDYNTGIIGITGMMAGKGILRIKTASGKEKKITITVNPSDFSNDRRTQSVAIQDIKVLTAYLLNNVTIIDEKIYIENIELTPKEVSLEIRSSKDINVSIYPSNATEQELAWTSNNPSVASVRNGVVTAVAEGTATITCTAKDGSGVSASCQVTVKPSVNDGEVIEVNSLRYRIYPSSNSAVVARQEQYLSGTITIPERISYKDINYTVTEIGDSAFLNKSVVKEISISSTVKKIGAYAFQGMSSLTSIEIPDNVESIGKEPFDYCSALESIYIGSGLKSLGIYPFWCCPKLSSINVSARNQYFTAEENILYSKDHKTVYKVPETMSKVYLHTSVQLISNGCFGDNDLIEKIDLPTELIDIAAQAFMYCDKLSSIDIPDNVKHIYASAFKRLFKNKCE